MSETQLRLLPYSKPLTERFGREFFLSIPDQPGVYLMRDMRERIIYVGKAKSLRNRLNSYRHVNPDRDSRKTVRLVHEVTRIDWEICGSERPSCYTEYSIQNAGFRIQPTVIQPPAFQNTDIQSSDTAIQIKDSAIQTNDMGIFEKNTQSHTLPKPPSVRLAAIAARKALRDRLAGAEPHLRRLYESFISERFPAAEGQRNEFIVNAVPFLYSAVGEEFILPLVMLHYECNRALFKDSPEQHKREADFQLKWCLENYPRRLSETEREYYEQIDEAERPVFRICRDLALFEGNEDYPPPLFFLSCHDLGERLGKRDQQAHRLLQSMITFEIIQCQKKGVKRRSGVKPTASVYRWLL